MKISKQEKDCRLKLDYKPPKSPKVNMIKATKKTTAKEPNFVR